MDLVKTIIKKILPGRLFLFLKHVIYHFYFKHFSKKHINHSIHGPLGINIIGPVNDLTGIAEGCRSNIRSIMSADIPLAIIDRSNTSSGCQCPEAWASNFRDDFIYSVNLFHMNPDVLKKCLMKFNTEELMNHYNIGFWAWELENIPAYWKETLSFFDEIWVPSHFTQQAVQKITQKPVNVIAHSLNFLALSSFMDTTKMDLRSKWKLKEDSFVFFSLYDTDSYASRKNPDAVIQSFIESFKKDENVELLLKVKLGKHKKIPKALALALNDPRIIIVTSVLSRDELNELYFLSDSLVSLHRSEGFGLSIAEAMSLGKPVIATNWSGNTDFMNDTNSCPVSFQYINVGSGFLPGTGKERWADPEISSAKQWMCNIYLNRNICKRIGERAQASTVKMLSPEIIGCELKKRLLEIQSKLC